MKKQIYIAFAILMMLGFVGSVLAFWPFDGVLKSPGQTVAVLCTDSDVSSSPSYTASSVTYKAAYGYNMIADSCKDSKTLKEAYCNKNKGSFKEVPCTNGCTNRACVKPAGNPGSDAVCTDSDEGIVSATAGITTASKSGVTNVRPDTCIANNRKLKEFSCNEDGELEADEIYCENDCTTTEITVEGNVQSAGSCTAKVNTCSETDTGMDYTLNGTTTAINSRAKPTTGRDKCLGDKRLKEYYCENNVLNSTEYTCPGVCKGGKCVDSSCTDTDNGKNWTVKGTVTTELSTATDFCLGSKRVAELYCGDAKTNMIRLVPKECKNGCNDGKCTGAEDNSGQGTDV